ncbi:hypothetical protein HDV03_000381 [Kappamyces sp. JEL0829]|nr:hypothetical protein HDV03_000381 [Kappamyces sp. JEL0829]
MSDFDKFAQLQWSVKLPPIEMYFKKPDKKPAGTHFRLVNLSDSLFDHQKNIPRKFEAGSENEVLGEGLGLSRKLTTPFPLKSNISHIPHTGSQTRHITNYMVVSPVAPLDDSMVWTKQAFLNGTLNPVPESPRRTTSRSESQNELGKNKSFKASSTVLMADHLSGQDKRSRKPHEPVVVLDAATVEEFFNVFKELESESDAAKPTANGQRGSQSELSEKELERLQKICSFIDKIKYRELARVISKKARAMVNNMARAMTKPAKQPVNDNFLSTLMRLDQDMNSSGNYEDHMRMFKDAEKRFSTLELTTEYKHSEIANFMKKLKEISKPMTFISHVLKDTPQSVTNSNISLFRPLEPVILPSSYRRLSSSIIVPRQVLVKSRKQPSANPKETADNADGDPHVFFHDFQSLHEEEGNGLQNSLVLRKNLSYPSVDFLDVVWNLFIHIKMMYEEVLSESFSESIFGLFSEAQSQVDCAKAIRGVLGGASRKDFVYIKAFTSHINRESDYGLASRQLADLFSTLIFRKPMPRTSNSYISANLKLDNSINLDLSNPNLVAANSNEESETLPVKVADDPKPDTNDSPANLSTEAPLFAELDTVLTVPVQYNEKPASAFRPEDTIEEEPEENFDNSLRDSQASSPSLLHQSFLNISSEHSSLTRRSTTREQPSRKSAAAASSPMHLEAKTKELAVPAKRGPAGRGLKKGTNPVYKTIAKEPDASGQSKLTKQEAGAKAKQELGTVKEFISTRSKDRTAIQKELESIFSWDQTRKADLPALVTQEVSLTPFGTALETILLQWQQIFEGLDGAHSLDDSTISRTVFTL